MTAEQLHKEVDMALEIYEKMKEVDYQSWHRVIGMVEQLRNNDQRLRDEYAKQAYQLGTPVVVR